MKTREQRGEAGWWAYSTRDALGITPEEVVERLGRYDPATLRKAEANSEHMSQPLWRGIVPLYRRLAIEKGVTIEPPPALESEGRATGDLAALVAALERQTAALREATDVWREVGTGLAGLLGRGAADETPEGRRAAS